MQTLMPYLAEYNKDQYNEDRSNFIIDFQWGSSIWLGGLDEGERLDKIMGEEYGLIFINEGTQITWDMFLALVSRNNWKGAKLKFIIDCNPKNPQHWLHRYFINKINPDTLEPLSEKQIAKCCRLSWGKLDNADNLSEEYIENLENMSGLRGKRLRDAIWCGSDEGTVYNFSRPVNHSEKPLAHIPGMETWCAWDFGINDLTALIFYQIIPIMATKDNPKGMIIQVFDEYKNKGKDYKHYARIVRSKGIHNLQHAGDPYDGKKRDAALGSWVTYLATEGIQIQMRRKPTQADRVENVNKYIKYMQVNDMQCPGFVEMCENWSYPKDAQDKVIEGVLPVHDEHSHFGTALGYGFGLTFPIKKKGEVIIR
jgi:hypothetical protein